VVTRIAGHADAVLHERTGLLVDTPAQLGPAIERVLTDNDMRATLATGALEHARRYTWAATARGTLEVLANEVLRRRRS
jgi:D-inositol-3-phosphate glycosyltransferase